MRKQRIRWPRNPNSLTKRAACLPESIDPSSHNSPRLVLKIGNIELSYTCEGTGEVAMWTQDSFPVFQTMVHLNVASKGTVMQVTRAQNQFCSNYKSPSKSGMGNLSLPDVAYHWSCWLELLEPTNMPTTFYYLVLGLTRWPLAKQEAVLLLHAG